MRLWIGWVVTNLLAVLRDTRTVQIERSGLYFYATQSGKDFLHGLSTLPALLARQPQQVQTRRWLNPL